MVLALRVMDGHNHICSQCFVRDEYHPMDYVRDTGCFRLWTAIVTFMLLFLVVSSVFVHGRP